MLIDISDATFSRLQGYATPLVDSVETALIKVLDLADFASTGGTKPHVNSATLSAPDLTHTALKSATVDGKALPPVACNWNGVMMWVAEEAAKHLPKGKHIADLIVVNHVQGQKEDNGYKFLPSLGI